MRPTVEWIHAHIKEFEWTPKICSRSQDCCYLIVLGQSNVVMMSAIARFPWKAERRSPRSVVWDVLFVAHEEACCRIDWSEVLWWRCVCREQTTDDPPPSTRCIMASTATPTNPNDLWRLKVGTSLPWVSIAISIWALSGTPGPRPLRMGGYEVSAGLL